MKKNSLTLAKAKLLIRRLVQKLLDLFLHGKTLVEKRHRLVTQLKSFEAANPDYCEIYDDQRERNKMNFRYLMLILSFLVDFFLLNTAVSVLCAEFGWPAILKFVVPVALILLEVGVSYFSALQARSEEYVSRIGRNLQYLVLPILVGFSLFVIFFSAQSYSEELDEVSLLGYLTVTVIIQSILLISSIMLHLWLIRNSEDIVEAIAYAIYRIKRKRITDAIEKIDKENTSVNIPLLTRLTHEFVRRTDTFKRTYPDDDEDFSIAMPQDLIDGMNKVMGKRVVGISEDNWNNPRKTR